MSNGNLHEAIKNVDSSNKNEVVGYALVNHAAMLVSQITREEYGKNCVILEEKLGYPPLPINKVQEEADKLIGVA